jgi:hypothetical protein
MRGGARSAARTGAGGLRNRLSNLRDTYGKVRDVYGKAQRASQVYNRVNDWA